MFAQQPPPPGQQQMYAPAMVPQQVNVLKGDASDSESEDSDWMSVTDGDTTVELKSVDWDGSAGTDDNAAQNYDGIIEFCIKYGGKPAIYIEVEGWHIEIKHHKEKDAQGNMQTRTEHIKHVDFYRKVDVTQAFGRKWTMGDKAEINRYCDSADALKKLEIIKCLDSDLSETRNKCREAIGGRYQHFRADIRLEKQLMEVFPTNSLSKCCRHGGTCLLSVLLCFWPCYCCVKQCCTTTFNLPMKYPLKKTDRKVWKKYRKQLIK